MAVDECFCGAEVDGGDDRESEVAAWHAHFTEHHPQFGITATQVRNRIERVEMLEPVGDRVAEIGDVEVVDLGPERVDDVLEFFDRHAFADNPNWASCYCMAHHVDGEWGERTWQQNREELAARIRAGTTSGVLGYVDGALVGWCNNSRRDQFPHYASGEQDDRACVAACFVVRPEFRGHGVGDVLLGAAIEQARRSGLDEMEGRPHPEPPDEGAAYRGTVERFTRMGFERVGDDGPHTAILRHRLTP
jgi:GNAT superfamily N-acetyltransferase